MEDLGERLVEHQDALVADMQAGGIAALWVLMTWKFWFENPENSLAPMLLSDLFEKWLVLDAMKHREVG